MATFKVNCSMQKNPNSVTVNVAPFRRDVLDKTPTIEWEADGNGTTFPATNYFSWKSGGPGTLPARSSDGKKLTLAYTQTAPSDWTYAISLENDGVTVDVDPEIHNDPPVP
ncbi:MAG TPA: hypothetical protein VF432_23295 [Thermoanaerobaculia bacterium]